MKKTLTFVALLIAFFYGTKNTKAQDNLIKNKNVKSLIEKKRKYSQYNGSGYRIQLYYGNENKAKIYERNFKAEFPWVFCKRGYDNPYWNVKVGSYRTRLDADRALNKIREKFSGAIVIEK